MRTKLSERRRKFYSTIEAANNQTTQWLTAAVMNPGACQSRLATLACIRVLAYRETSGRPYLEKKRAVKARIAALKVAPIY